LSGKVLKHVLIKYGTAQTINRRDGCSGWFWSALVA
jgi:hypothetical protein